MKKRDIYMLEIVETAKATSQKLEHCIGFAVSLHGAVKYYDGQVMG